MAQVCLVDAFFVVGLAVVKAVLVEIVVVKAVFVEIVVLELALRRVRHSHDSPIGNARSKRPRVVFLLLLSTSAASLVSLV